MILQFIAKSLSIYSEKGLALNTPFSSYVEGGGGGGGLVNTVQAGTAELGSSSIAWAAYLG